MSNSLEVLAEPNRGIAGRVRQQLLHVFDFYENHEFANHEFALYGKYFRRNSKYFAVKRAEIAAFANYEHLFLKRVEGKLTESEFESVVAALKESAERLIQPNHEHMSSIITIVFDCDRYDSELVDRVTNYKHRKNFKLGFFGWVDFKIILIDADGNYVESKLAKGDVVRLKLFGEA